MYLKEEIDMFKLFLVLGIIVFLIVLPFVVKDKRIFFLWIGGLAVWIIGLTVLNRIACGPNSHDVKIMKPQAKVIVDYIVKNGIPKSLGDIPDLPYVLVECNRQEAYMAKHSSDIVKSRKDAGGIKVKEKCFFKKEDKLYRVKLRFFDSYTFTTNSGGEVNVHSLASKTSISYTLKINKRNNWKIDKYSPHIYSTNDTGICRTFRQ